MEQRHREAGYYSNAVVNTKRKDINESRSLA
jgi:hypothetical protein